jgi:hypothetical protein
MSKLIPIIVNDVNNKRQKMNASLLIMKVGPTPESVMSYNTSEDGQYL